MGSGGGDEEGELTRFPCLATVRSLVASVVTVLAIAVVVMVILAVHRPEDISLSIRRGYIQADPLWWNTSNVSNPYGRARGRGGRSAGYDLEPGIIGNNHLPVQDDSISFYEPAKTPVTLEVTWSAYNPSGRGKVDCNVTAIRVLDMEPVPAVTEDMEIGRADDIISPRTPLRFSVPQKASHTEMQYLTIRDKGVLQYLVDRYGGRSSFMATVQVNITITYHYQVQLPSSSSSSTGMKSAIQYDCGPVAVVHGAPDDTYAGVTCTTAGQDGLR